MIRSKSMTLFAGAAVIPLTALAVGCGGGGGGATAATRLSPAPRPAKAAGSTVRVAKTGLGKVLVNSSGRTLYLFKKDSRNKSACSGACATFWPPLRTSGKPRAGSGVRASLLGSIKRSDGRSQVTYNGHPLYTFVMDSKAGQTNGEGKLAFGGKWFAVSPSGKQVSPHASKSAAGSAAAAKAAPKPASQPAAPKPMPQPAAPNPAPQPAPQPAAPKPPPANNGIPQNGGGDGDSDNNGGPDDGDGGV